MHRYEANILPVFLKLDSVNYSFFVLPEEFFSTGTGITENVDQVSNSVIILASTASMQVSK